MIIGIELFSLNSYLYITGIIFDIVKFKGR